MSEMPTMGELPEMEALDESAGLGEVVSRVNVNTSAIYAGLKVLRDIALSYAAALPASIADRKTLHELVDALRRGLSAVAQTSSDAASAAGAASSKASAASSAVTSLAAKQPRVASGMAPAMTNVLSPTSADVTLTWPAAWPDATYQVLAVIEPPASLLGKVSVAVKSKTAATVVLTVTTSAVLASGTVPVRAASFP